MRYVGFDGKQTSVLGFGCGAVMGRVGRSDSLRAMAVAWDAGVTLFDTARSYGYGEAEGLLGEFLQGKRDRAVISTKFGIWPGKQSLLKRVAKPVVRAALRLAPGARGLVRRGAAGEITAGQFTVPVLKASLEESLRQLRTDHVDLLFLHEGTAAAMRDQELLRALEDVVREGKVRRAGISPVDPGVVHDAMLEGPPVLKAVQFAANLFDLRGVMAAGQTAGRGLFLVANHPFGGLQRAEEVQARLRGLAADEGIAPELREKLQAGGRTMLAELVFGLILRGTGVHAVVPSMMREENLRANLAAIESERFTDKELAEVRARLL